MRKLLLSRWTKTVVFLLCLVPLERLLWLAYRQDLGANPVELITHTTGDWIIRFLLITLSITPLRQLLGLPPLARFRRMFGLFAFFYGCLHLATWMWMDKSFDVNEMLKDIAKRRFITVGMLAFTLLLPLALTSTAGWVRRMGFVKWQRLHRLIYFSALAGVIHYYWLVKSDVRLPLMYGAILAVLMGYRFFIWTRSTLRPEREKSTTPSKAYLRD